MTFHSTSSLTVPEKLCSRCRQVKPVDQFNTVLHKWTRKDGTKVERRYPTPQCKACDAIRHARWYRTPEGKGWSKQNAKEQYNQMRKDPKLLRRRQKVCRDWQRENGKAYKEYVRYLRPLMK